MICQQCFGSGCLPVEILVKRSTIRPNGLVRPCDYPGCLGGFVYCCEPPVNRWEGEKVVVKGLGETS